MAIREKLLAVICLMPVLLAAGCDNAPAKPGEATAAEAGAPRPNILWVVWDTARRDRMSVYGHSAKTTPNVEEWARGARVYTNCLATSGTTAPSHASMFTGLLPSEHGSSNEHPQLDSRLETIAELLRDRAGYDTFLFAANPHLTDSAKFTQGFDVAEHPWSEAWRAEAAQLIRAKLDPRDETSEIGRKLAAGQLNDWTIKTAGALAEPALARWLDSRSADKPFFAFLNYMEAHRPLLPGAEFREQMMAAEEIARSFAVDRSWNKTWAYTLGFAEYTDEELELTRKTYDACLLELDFLFGRLLRMLRERGALENTVVILTSDHGEHLGEHHMLDHQYSLYNVLLEVPLIVHYPPAFEPARDDQPVMTFDLFPTLLRLAGLTPPAGLHAVDLREAASGRERLAEYPVATSGPIETVKRQFPSLNEARWRRALRALSRDGSKYICGSDGSHELYDLANDPGELRNLATENLARIGEFCRRLRDTVAELRPPGGREAPAPRTAEELRALEALGYTAQAQEAEDEAPASLNFCDCPAVGPAHP